MAAVDLQGGAVGAGGSGPAPSHGVEDEVGAHFGAPLPAEDRAGEPSITKPKKTRPRCAPSIVTGTISRE